MDVLGAETEGMIGHLLAQALENELPEREIATLLTQTIVDPGDPAFGNPSKPVGPVYDQEQANSIARERGWTVARDGRFFRRVVPSPEPRSIVGLGAIRILVSHGVLVICTGGGGVPVVADEGGGLRGVEAVVDKDRAAGLLARKLEFDLLLLLTDVDVVQLDWGTPRARPIRRTTPAELREQNFASGSMGPKVEAACRFVETTGGTAGIGALADAAAILRGDAGTIVVSSKQRT